MGKLTSVVLVMTALALGLTGCGRKGRPYEPEGSTYPRRLPDVSFPKGTPTPPDELLLQQQERQQKQDATSPTQMQPFPGTGLGTETKIR